MAYLFTWNNEHCIIVCNLMEEFEMKDLGHITYFLDIEFQKTNKGLLMQKRRYALEILKKFELKHCNSTTTPEEPRLQQSKEEDEKWVDLTQYRRLIGSLRYSCNTRPNLVCSVGIVSRFMEKPKMSHLLNSKLSLGTSKDQWIVASCFKHLTREKAANYTNTLTLIGMVSKIIENQLQCTSLCVEKQQFLGAQGRSQLWHYHHTNLNKLQHLCMFVKLCAWWFWYKKCVMRSVMRWHWRLTMCWINLAKYSIAHGRYNHIEVKFYYLREQLFEWRLKLEHC